jgi:hypothetical protein
MPFDFSEYYSKCSKISPKELQNEWNHYTRLITGSTTSTTIPGLAALPTLGVSLIGVTLGSSGIRNARKKRAIIEQHLARQGQEPATYTKDVLRPAVFSGAVGLVTLGISAERATFVMGHGL